MNYSNALQLAEKIALELVFAQPGRDEGLLPVNSLLSDLSELVASEPAVPDPIRQGMTITRECVDDALVAGGFTANLLERLSALVSWLPVALRAWEHKWFNTGSAARFRSERRSQPGHCLRRTHGSRHDSRGNGP